MTAYRVRPATPADAEAICRIYNQGIEDRVATLETERRTPEERRRWLAGRSPRHPVIVAETTEPTRGGRGLADPGTAVGWGSLNVFHAREAYRVVADLSVYVARARPDPVALTRTPGARSRPARCRARNASSVRRMPSASGVGGAGPRSFW